MSGSLFIIIGAIVFLSGLAIYAGGNVSGAAIDCTKMTNHQLITKCQDAIASESFPSLFRILIVGIVLMSIGFCKKIYEINSTDTTPRREAKT